MFEQPSTHKRDRLQRNAERREGFKRDLKELGRAYVKEGKKFLGL
ncbi:hypothetical protein [Novosphingobium aquae]|uniref:Uncharacterized protein n=1 Tax=Novosphingobium aquae TaxID=3133435 RepID=A0ABU8SD57_9SPHN